MIFPNLEIENILQVNDRTRLDATKTFITPNEAPISLIEIDPGTGDFIDVTETRYLDFAYDTDGIKAITVRVTTDGDPVVVAKSLQVISITTDKLFSNDAELVPHEPKILQWVRAGRNSFLDVHRTAQDRILSHFDENGKWDIEGNSLSIEDVTNPEEFNEWSKYMTLRLIFEGISNATDDIFREKAERYRILEEVARDRKRFRIDRDNDGSADGDDDNFQSRSISVIRG